MAIFHYYNLASSEVFIFDNFLINQIKEGIVIEPKHKEILNDIIQKHFNGNNMAYISNRVQSYAVNPMTYKEVEKIPNLVGIAIISKNEAMRKSAEYEKKFYNKPYEVFNKLSDAFIWVHRIIMEANKKNT